nr:F-box protein PP2-B13-like isoform X1 [Ipomoea trifida]
MADYERELGMLPEDCISCILCRTSPLDAFHLSLVSSTFRSAAGADSVWEGFLPSDYAQIVAKSTVPLKFSSKKDLFLQLCNSILIDDGNKSFALEKSTGLKSYMLSARELSIRYGYAPDHWAWKYTPESRFAEVAELKTICRLEIQGKIRTETLSPNTKYGAYMVMKMTDGAFGLDAIPCEMSVAVGNDTEATGGTAYLRKPAEVVAKQWLEYALYRNRKEKLKSRQQRRKQNKYENQPIPYADTSSSSFELSASACDLESSSGCDFCSDSGFSGTDFNDEPCILSFTSLPFKRH